MKQVDSDSGFPTDKISEILLHPFCSNLQTELIKELPVDIRGYLSAKTQEHTQINLPSYFNL